MYFIIIIVLFCLCVCMCVYIPFKLCSIRKIHDFMYTLLSWRRFIKSDGGSNVDRPFSFPFFLNPFVMHEAHIYHMPVPRLYTINRAHITPLLLLLLLLLPPPHCYRPYCHHWYIVPSSTVWLANRWLIRLPGFSFRRSFTGSMTETRTQNTNYVYESLLAL